MWSATLLKWRWDLVAVTGVALFFVGATTDRSAYFLHLDTPSQDFAALAWIRGCWEWNTEKILPVLLLGFVFQVIGPDPKAEMLLLIGISALCTTLVYELARLTGKSRLAAWWSISLLLALPAYQYFSRTYLGYATLFLLLGWLSALKNQWMWAGLCFGLAITAHFAVIVLVGTSVLALNLIHLPTITRKQLLHFIAAFVMPLLAVDMLFFAYYGRVFAWSIGTVSNILRLSRLGSTSGSNWLWVLKSVYGSNGLALSVLLALATVAVFGLRHNKDGIALYLTCLGSCAALTLQAGITRSILLSKVLVYFYPFAAICAGIAAAWLVKQLSPALVWSTTTLLVTSALLVASLQTGVFLRQFTRTPYPRVEYWMQRASEEDLAVLLIGDVKLIPVFLFFAQKHGVELSISNDDIIPIDTPSNTVIVFETRAQLTPDPAKYVVDTVDISPPNEAAYATLIQEAEIARHLEAWWPKETQPSDNTVGKTYRELYEGSGCVTPPQYGNGTMHFYQLVIHKITKTLGVR